MPDDLPYLGLEHIERGGRILGFQTIGEAKLASTKFTFDEGHVLFGKLRPNLGKVARPEFRGVCSTDILPIRPGRNLDRAYLQYFLAQPEVVAFAASRTSGANLPRLSPTVLATFQIPLPPLDEQRRIAAILDQVAALRAKRRQALAYLDALADSSFADAIRGAVDRDWRQFDEVCLRITVGVVIKPASYYVPNGVPALRTLNVKPGDLDLRELVYFSQTSNDGPLAKSKLREGDLVIARTGRPGTAAVIPPQLHGANAIDLIVVTPDPAVAHPMFLEGLMNSAVGKNLVAGEQRGQIQQHFNVGSLKAASIPVLPVERQRSLVVLLKKVRNAKSAQMRQLLELDNLFLSFQSRAFSGLDSATTGG